MSAMKFCNASYRSTEHCNSVADDTPTATTTPDASDEVFALSHTTDVAAMTVVCKATDKARIFAFSVLSEFQTALALSNELRAANKCRLSTSHIVHERLSALPCESVDWIAIYVDPVCVRVFGRGGFTCYFLDVKENFASVGGCANFEPFDRQCWLLGGGDEALTLLVTNAAIARHERHADEIRCLIQASHLVKSTTDSLAVAFVQWAVRKSEFCVLTFSTRRMAADESVPAPKPPGSPKKSELRVLDSHNDCIPMSRHCIAHSTDAMSADTIEAQ